jgi:hypothetical protein
MASYLKLLLICLTCLSCQVRSIETTSISASTPPKHQQNATMTLSKDSTQGLPDALKAIQPLWEVERQDTSKQAGSTTRLYENGQLYTWSNTRRIVVDGKPSRETAPYLWRLDAQLKPEGVVKIRELIYSGFTKLESSTPNIGTDRGIEIRRSYLDGIEHHLVLPTSATKDLPQVIRDIDRAIQSNIMPGAVPLAQ